MLRDMGRVLRLAEFRRLFKTAASIEARDQMTAEARDQMTAGIAGPPIPSLSPMYMTFFLRFFSWLRQVASVRK